MPALGGDTHAQEQLAALDRLRNAGEARVRQAELALPIGERVIRRILGAGERAGCGGEGELPCLGVEIGERIGDGAPEAMLIAVVIAIGERSVKTAMDSATELAKLDGRVIAYTLRQLFNSLVGRAGGEV
ncbi:hypothetical protein [Methylosinus sp. H3A]|uniref:hypothetical protein n=1 Tax=Methylosinus sp. H3A TaxID=2785786 RepID=UPI001FED85A6|nr:hypothetical protein [Methylosinus sp. H3A]